VRSRSVGGVGGEHVPGGKPLERRNFRLQGVSPDVPVFIPENSLVNLCAAMTYRMEYVRYGGEVIELPQPLGATFTLRGGWRYTSESTRGFASSARKLMTLVRPVPSLSGKQYCQTFRGNDRRRYLKVWEAMQQSSLTLKHYRINKAFVKIETLLKVDPDPRLISPDQMEVNIAIGRIIKPGEKEIFGSIDKLFESTEPCIMKGMNALEMGRTISRKFHRFDKCYIYNGDFSRFDATVRRPFLQLANEVHCALATGDEKSELRKHYSRKLKGMVKGRAKDGKYSVYRDGSITSGKVDTSSGGCIINACALHAWGEKVASKMEPAINGDDVVCFAPVSDFNVGVTEAYSRWGFLFELAGPYENMEDVEFCSTKPVFVGPGIHDYLMVRNPRDAIVKDSISKFETTDRGFEAWLFEVGTAGLHLYGCMPIFRSFYNMLRRFGCKGKLSGKVNTWWVRHLGYGLDYRRAVIRDETRASFCFAFGISPDEQVVIEQYYDSAVYRRDGVRCIPEVLDLLLGC
jgi:hypothetical protein